MEQENPPPPPTLEEQRTQQLDPQSVLPDEHTGYPWYKHIHANSGSFHNNAIRRLSLHMQIGGAAFVLNVWNKLKVYDHDKYLAVLGDKRPPNQALLTLSNHQSTIDDPALLAAVTPYKIMTDPIASRWGWCAREMCFPTKFTGWFFLHGKIFPIVRGLGLFQQGVRQAEEHLVKGEHMHIFPEGKCIPLPNGIAQLRWGAGKLIADAYRRSRRCEEAKAAFLASTAAAAESTTAMAAASASTPSASPSKHLLPAATFASALSAVTATANFASPGVRPSRSSSDPSIPCPLPPIVLPMVHHGMIKVMPFYHTIPKRGHTVRAIFGDRIEFGDIIEWYERNQANTDAFDYPREEDLYIAITDRVYEKLVGLDKRLVEIEQEEGAPVQC